MHHYPAINHPKWRLYERIRTSSFLPFSANDASKLPDCERWWDLQLLDYRLLPLRGENLLSIALVKLESLGAREDVVSNIHWYYYSDYPWWRPESFLPTPQYHSTSPSFIFDSSVFNLCHLDFHYFFSALNFLFLNVRSSGFLLGCKSKSHIHFHRSKTVSFPTSFFEAFSSLERKLPFSNSRFFFT